MTPVRSAALVSGLVVLLGACGDAESTYVEEQSSGAETELELVEVRVSGDKATADIDSRSEQEGPARLGLTLEREDEDWRITGFQ